MDLSVLWLSAGSRFLFPESPHGQGRILRGFALRSKRASPNFHPNVRYSRTRAPLAQLRVRGGPGKSGFVRHDPGAASWRTNRVSLTTIIMMSVD
jgi:hypothetical protein